MNALGLLALAILLLLPGLPLVRRVTPVEPSPLKLGLFGALLSPAVVLALERAAAAVLPAGGVAPVTWGLLGAGLLLGLCARGARPLRRAPLGRAAWMAVGLGVVAAALALWWARGPAARLGHDGLARVLGAAQLLLETGRAEDPWLAGEPLGVETLHAHALAALARLSGLGVSWCAVGLNAWGVLCAVLTLHLSSAVLWRDGRADLAAPLLALLGAGGLAGLARLGAAADPSGGWAVALARAVGGAPGEVLHSGMVWLRGGPAVPALALTWAGLYAAAHGLRHGQAPWPLLTGLCLALALAWFPAVGIAGALAVLLLLPAADARARRPSALLPMVLPLVPAGLHAASLGLVGVEGRVLASSVAARGAGWSLLPLVALAALGLARARPLLAGRAHARLLLGLFAAAAAASGALALSSGDGPATLHLAVGPLAVLAAGCVARAVRVGEGALASADLGPVGLEGPDGAASVAGGGGGGARAIAGLGALGVLLLLASGLALGASSAAVHERLARSPCSGADPLGRLQLRAPRDPRQQALEALPEGLPVAMRLAAEDPRLPPAPGLSLRGVASGHALLVDPLQLDGAAAATGEAQEHGDPRGEEVQRRSAAVSELLAGRVRSGVDVGAWLGLPGRSLAVLVDDLDRRRAHPGLDPAVAPLLDAHLESLGLRRLSTHGPVAAFLWEVQP